MPKAVFRYIPVNPFVAGTLAVLQPSDNSQILLFGKTFGQHVVQDFSSVIPVEYQCRGGRLLQHVEHICGMIQYSLGNSERRVVILISTFQSQRLSFRHRVVMVIRQMPDYCQHHHDAECHQSVSSHHTLHPVADDFAAFVVQLVIVVHEMSVQERWNTHFVCRCLPLDFTPKFLVLHSQLTEHFRFGLLGISYDKHVADVPFELYIEEHETAEQSVLGILYEVTNLSRCPCQHDTQLGAVHFKELPVLTAAQ